MRKIVMSALLVVCSVLACAVSHAAQDNWANDLAPISEQDWTAARAAHLLERAGFGGTPNDIARYTAMGPDAAVKAVVDVSSAASANANRHLPPFDESSIHDPGLEPFPASRPAVTNQAKATGQALGIKVNPTGNRRMQPVVDKFFYWLRASRLDTDRLAYWWANRMLATATPLQEKMALFWHGHFANNEEKVRDYRKMKRQLDLFQVKGTGNFRDLLIGAAQDPAMLAFLDAGVNVKGAPNENFAREIMELFTMGVASNGVPNYSESDIREAARAFTGWNYQNLSFKENQDKHDAGVKTILGAGSRQGCCWSGAILRGICCSPTSIFCRLTVTLTTKPSVSSATKLTRAKTSAPPPNPKARAWAAQARRCSPCLPPWPTAMKISTPAMAVFAAGNWPLKK